MNRLLYEKRCKCNEEFSIIKKRKGTYKSEGKPLAYPKTQEIMSKTFHMKYKIKLSVTAKIIFNSFHNKYIYYAIDDILYFLSSYPNERDYILAVLYSPIISLQNNFSVNFFDIWIRDISIDKISNSNKFIKNEPYLKKNYDSIAITFFYKTKALVKKQDSLW